MHAAEICSYGFDVLCGSIALAVIAWTIVGSYCYIKDANR